MKPSLRFLALALAGWVGVRAATLGSLPGAEIFSIERSEAKPPSLITTEFPPIEPVALAPPQMAFAGMPPGYMPYGQMPQYVPISMRPIAVPVYYASMPATRPPDQRPIATAPSPAFYSPIPPLDEWPLSRIASASLGERRQASRVPIQSSPVVAASRRFDRLQLTSWALLRGRQGQPLGPSSLASGGTLGGSQAGARLSYNVTRQLAASLRTSTDVGRRGGEVAAGVRVQPVSGLPLWLTAERRQRIGRFGSGRNAFALFAETGVYGRPMPWGFTLDGYLQGGVVGMRSRDVFIDGGATLTRPLFRQFSAGVGIWGGAQPGVYRLDAGPRLSMRVRNTVRVHLDWRQQLAGNAQPGSGPAITLAGDF
jgi:hypothetical protein